MKKIFKRVTALVLCAAMLLSVAGCGKKSKNAVTIDKNTIYKEETISIPFPEKSYVSRIAIGGDRIYFIGYTYDEKTYNSEYFIGSCNIDGSDYKSTPLKPGDSVSSSYVQNIFTTKSGNAMVTLNEYFEDDSDPENYVWESHFYLAAVNPAGEIITKNDLSDEGIEYVERVMLLKDGRFLMYSNNSLYLIDENAKLISKKEVSDGIYVSSFFQLKDGTPVVTYWGDDGLDTCKKVDLNTLTFGEEVKFPFSAFNYNMLSGNEQYDVLLRNGYGIYGYNLGDADVTELLNIINSDIYTSYFDSFESLSDGNFIASYQEEDGETSKTVVAKYTKIDPKNYVEKEVISLGCQYLNSDVRRNVVKYNKSNDKYRIAIKDYSSYNTEEDYSAGMNKLNSDIASGQAPDIILSNDGNLISNYAAKGLFVDLYKYLDKDSTVNKDDIWPNLLKASERDGKLCQLVPFFYIQTFAGKKSVLGDRKGWTISEMQAFEDTLPEGVSLLGSDMTREGFLGMMLYLQAADYMDTVKATCDFNSDEFKELLKYAAKLPESNDMNMDDSFYNDYSSQWREGRTVIYSWYMSDVSSYKELLRGYFGEEATIIGYPTKDGSNGSVMNFDSSFAISSKSKNPEAAWDFIKTFWSKDYQENGSWEIPAVKSVFVEKSKSAMERPFYIDYETGEKVYYDDTFWAGMDTQITMEPLTQAEIDTLIDFISTVDKVCGVLDEDISKIINDEAASFFSGQKSVDEVTNIIQNRVSTYLKEKQ